MLKIDPTKRFSSRVENYALFRPSYPKEVIDALEDECDLTAQTVVADVASGTGIFTRLLLEHGNRVFGVEPNPDMRRAGEEYLSGYPGFVSVDGTAEATTLPDRSVDLITSAQAAHWFDRERALAEFRRILRPGGYVSLIWNDRQVDTGGFGSDYEQMVMRFGTDYAEVKRRDLASGQFFDSLSFRSRVLPNYQDLDYTALEGRLLSSSYVPQEDGPSHASILAELRRIFNRHQRGGRVRMEYDTKLYLCRLGE